ncbi:putative aldo/keto reductase [Colletotrichum karsti]|uniref:Aldo/keto reductase n=1 Tax=Colletotrichum karsti TaxID=1095194 RepID=A0A9P6LIR0_9PEZI|nr:putative aldo/keto reductase [Colletotrichum karsti]KAF9874426.1 putative aldo/keto reductase [Colletotrichum karsti]
MAPPICTKTFKLNNGIEFPAVGLGTWQGSKGTDDEKALEESIIHALKVGYRMVDTAQIYGVEEVVGRAIRNSGVPRSEIIVVTKFWGEWHHDPAAALKISLDTLGLDYIDVFLMHWPWATTPAPEKKPLKKHESPTIVETWKKMEALVGEKCRAIGVSNFMPKVMDELLAEAKIVPAVNQVELHAFNPNLKLVPYCQEKGIHVTGWSTLGGSRTTKNEILSHELFTSIAKSHDCSPGVVSLSWAVQRGTTIIPKSANKSRIEENIRLVTLTDEEMNKINEAHKIIRKERFSDGIDKQGWDNIDMGYEDENGNWLA